MNILAKYPHKHKVSNRKQLHNHHTVEAVANKIYDDANKESTTLPDDPTLLNEYYTIAKEPLQIGMDKARRKGCKLAADVATPSTMVAHRRQSGKTHWSVYSMPQMDGKVSNVHEQLLRNTNKIDPSKEMTGRFTVMADHGIAQLTPEPGKVGSYITPMDHSLTSAMPPIPTPLPVPSFMNNSSFVSDPPKHDDYSKNRLVGDAFKCLSSMAGAGGSAAESLAMLA